LRHWPSNLVRAALVTAGVVLLASAADAVDKVRTSSGIGYPGEIVGVSGDGLEMKIGRRKSVVPFGEIRSISSDDYPDLERAEALYAKGAKGDAEAMKQAADLYDDLLSSRSPEWLRTVVQWRMYGVYAQSGQVRKALDAYLEMAGQSPKLVAGLQLPQPQEGDRQANRAMLQQVEKALRKAGDAPYADALKNFRVSLLLLEGDPNEVLASGVLDKLIQSQDPKVRLNAMMKRLELLLAVEKKQEAAAWFDRIKAADLDMHPADLAYWNGRILETQGRHVEAALAFMRLPILYGQRDRVRTAEALWRAGKALEAAQAPKDEAKVVYQEAVNDYGGTTGADRARRDLARLGAE